MQAQPPCCYSIQLCPRFAGLPTFCKLVLNYNAVDLAGKGGASIQRNDAIAIIGRKIGLVVKFAAIVVVMGMTERAMPMTADNGFPGFGDTAVGSLHTVDPPGLVPLLSACVAPICDVVITNGRKRFLRGSFLAPALLREKDMCGAANAVPMQL